ncbi:hypothetical protein CDAR_556061 [Caerostris darwini]|uniref:Uncharacterized protein n=1 Tax=Caerostris darwini TaxID=1538125 RepID=A0AAV4UVQ2_9ARAC|nr:hypothetical protein CDAR_556061 [Caerostris darwini]
MDCKQEDPGQEQLAEHVGDLQYCCGRRGVVVATAHPFGKGGGEFLSSFVSQTTYTSGNFHTSQQALLGHAFMKTIPSTHLDSLSSDHAAPSISRPFRYGNRMKSPFLPEQEHW